MIGDMTRWIMDVMQAHGPAMVFVGVIIESIIVPIPSPLIIMGAGALLIDPTFSWTSALAPIFLLIVVPGSVASTLGAFFAFGIAYWGGKPVIDRWNRFLGFDWNDILAMEKRLAGRMGLMIFALRAIPVVPLSLISAAAGVLRLPVGAFTLWTFAGSIPRCLLLGYLGYLTRDAYQGLAGGINRLESFFSVLMVGFMLVLVLYLRHRYR